MGQGRADEASRRFGSTRSGEGRRLGMGWTGAGRLGQSGKGRGGANQGCRIGAGPGSCGGSGRAGLDRLVGWGTDWDGAVWEVGGGGETGWVGAGGEVGEGAGSAGAGRGDLVVLSSRSYRRRVLMQRPPLQAGAAIGGSHGRNWHPVVTEHSRSFLRIPGRTIWIHVSFFPGKSCGLGRPRVGQALGSRGLARADEGSRVRDGKGRAGQSGATGVGTTRAGAGSREGLGWRGTGRLVGTD